MKRIDWVSGLKGICAVIVLLRHYVNAFFPALHTALDKHAWIIFEGNSVESVMNKTPLYLLINGGYVVYIFWTFSAFLIAYQYYKNSLKDFIARKALKKYLGLLGVIFVTYIIAYLGMKMGIFYNAIAAVYTNSEWYTYFYNWDPSFQQLLVSLFIDTFFTSNVPFNPVLWTIKIEFLGSLFALFLLDIFGSKRNRYIIYLIISILMIFSFPLQYQCFIVGIVLGDIYANKNVDKLRNVGIIMFIVSLYGGYPSDFQPIEGCYAWIPIQITAIGVWDTRTIIYVISASLCIGGVICSKRLQSFFSKKILLKLGSYSTEIYMLHFLVQCSISAYLFVVLRNLKLNYVLSFLIMLVVSFAVIILLGIGLKKLNFYYDKFVNKSISWLLRAESKLINKETSINARE